MSEKHATKAQLLAENAELRARLEKADLTLHEFRSGEADALFVEGLGGAQLFSLKGADQAYRMLVEQMREGALTLTTEGVIRYANLSFAWLLKTPLQKVIGSTVRTWIAPGSQPVLQSLLQKGAGEERHGEISLVASDGTAVPVYLSVSNLLIDGIPDAYCLVATDLTEHQRSEAIAASEKVSQALLSAANQSREELLRLIEEKTRAQQSLQISESKYKRLVENSPDIVYALSAKRGGIYFSSRVDSVLGYSVKHLYTNPCLWSESIHEEDRAAVAKAVEELRTGAPFDIEYRIKNAQGDWRWLNDRSMGSREESGDLIIEGLAMDITESKRTKLDLIWRTAFFEALVRTSVDGILVVDNQGKKILQNQRFTELLKIPEEISENLDDATQLQFVTNQVIDTQQFVDKVRYLTEHEEETSQDEVALKDGTTLERYSAPVLDGDGHFFGRIWSFHDITKRKAAEVKLLHLSQAVEQSLDSIVITNLEAKIEYVNEAFVRNTGYSRQEAIGQDSRILQSGFTAKETYASLWKAMTEGQPWRGELHNKRKDGSQYTELAAISPIHQPDGVITHYVAVKSDITEKKAAEEEINQLAFYDVLTKLPNRRLLLDRLQQALASSSRTQCNGALLLVNLDNFKTINDTLGHDMGDLLLQEVAQRLMRCIREGDTVARTGGDEFKVILENLSNNLPEAANAAKIFGEKILAALNQPYQLSNNMYLSTSSIGVTMFGNQKMAVGGLLTQVELAMYQSKAAGRNTMRFFDPEMQAVVTTRAVLEADIREAIVKEQFVLHYQAQMTGDGQLTGAEVLIRWQHPERGMVSPAEFIPLAEDTGLILPIGQWALETACTQLTIWAQKPAFVHLTLAVNVSARQFHQKDFVQEVLETLERTGAKPERLKLELTEGMLIEDVEAVIAKMTYLKGKGVSFSLDDFGTGFSSLAYLKRLPLDQLKIDQGFVRDILLDPNDAAIAKTVIALADSLGLAVIAEGVETVDQRDVLAEMGCHNYQGYLFSRPLPLQAFEAFVNRI